MYTHTHSNTDALLSLVTCSPSPSHSPPHKRMRAQRTRCERHGGPLYVRAPSKHSYGCYMLQLLPDGLEENILGLFSHWHIARPPRRDGGARRGTEEMRGGGGGGWQEGNVKIYIQFKMQKRSSTDPRPPIVLSDCKFPGPFSSVYSEVSMKQGSERVRVCVLVLLSFQNIQLNVCLSKLTLV